MYDNPENFVEYLQNYDYLKPGLGRTFVFKNEDYWHAIEEYVLIMINHYQDNNVCPLCICIDGVNICNEHTQSINCQFCYKCLHYRSVCQCEGGENAGLI